MNSIIKAQDLRHCAKCCASQIKTNKLFRRAYAGEFDTPEKIATAICEAANNGAVIGTYHVRHQIVGRAA